MNKSFIYGFLFLAILGSECSNNEKENSNTRSETLGSRTIASLELQEKKPCPPLAYSEEFEAIFITLSECGELNDIELIYSYVNGSCTNTKKMVNMEKYQSFDTGKVCPDESKIYRYEKIK